MDSVLSIRLTVSGKVQGVFFRQSASDVANKLGLSGFVQNLPNGDVLIEVHGIASNVEELYQWSLKGPMLAHVKSVHREEIPTTTLNKRFVVLKDLP